MNTDGATDCSGAIRAAVYELRDRYGRGRLHLPRPSVAYAFKEPVIVPEGIEIVGDGMFSTEIRGTADFPPDRCLFEFETGGTTIGNRISDMTIRPAPVDGCGAISYTPVDSADTGERWHGILKNLRFHGSNQYNPFYISLVANVHGARFINLWGDPSLTVASGVGSPTYDTVLLKLGDGTDEGLDVAGGYSCVIEGLTCTPVRGGFCAAIRGSLTASSVRCISIGKGTAGTPYIDLRNSSGTTFDNVLIEGGGGRPMIRLEAARHCEIRGLMLGNPSRNSPTVSTLGNGIEMIDCSDTDVYGAARWTGTPSWSHLNYPTEPAESKYAVALDEDTTNCLVSIDIGNIDTLATATNDLGDNNRVRTRRPYDGLIEETYNKVAV